MLYCLSPRSPQPPRPPPRPQHPQRPQRPRHPQHQSRPPRLPRRPHASCDWCASWSKRDDDPKMVRRRLSAVPLGPNALNEVFMTTTRSTVLGADVLTRNEICSRASRQSMEPPLAAGELIVSTTLQAAEVKLSNSSGWPLVLDEYVAVQRVSPSASACGSNETR